MKCKINYNRIIANAGIAFCSTLSATAIAGNPELTASIISAIILAGLAFFTELKVESEGNTAVIQSIINKSLII